MESTTNELVKLFRDRLRYPIITVYGIVLIVYNWDVLAVFFLSNLEIEERIKYINETFNDPYFSRLWKPLVKAIILSILAPLAMWGLEFITRQINLKRQVIKDKRNVEILTSKLKSANLEFQIEEAKSGKRSLEDLNNRIGELESSVQLSRVENDDKNNLIKVLNERIKEQEQTILDENKENLKHTRFISDIVTDVKSRFSIFGDETTLHLFKFIDRNKDGFKLNDLKLSFIPELEPFALDTAFGTIQMLKELNLIETDEDDINYLTPIGKLVTKYIL